MESQVEISVISPVYMAEDILEQLVDQVSDTVSKITSDFEIILVEDGSGDGSWERIASICKGNQRVNGIKLSRNFGQHQAITAGLEHSMGKWVVVMDCDLQDNPQEIYNLCQKANEGYDVVFAKRVIRKDGLFTRLGSKWFYKILSYLTGYHQDHTVANFGIYSRKVIDNVLRLKEQIRWLPLNVKWTGFKSTEIQVDHEARTIGKSSYSLAKKINLAFQLIISFSDKPLKLTIKFGLLVSIVALIVGLYFIIKSFFIEIPVAGWLTVVVSMWFLFGILITIVGVIGLYIGRILAEVKARPLYIIEKAIDNDV